MDVFKYLYEGYFFKTNKDINIHNTNGTNI
jgi:hypothetical protein